MASAFTPLSFALSKAIKFTRLSPVIVSASANVITSSAIAVEMSATELMIQAAASRIFRSIIIFNSK